MPDYWLELPHLRQQEEDTCTPASVRMVLAFHGVQRQERELAELLETKDGTAFSQIRKVESLGFDVWLGSGTHDDLERIRDTGSPLIVPVQNLCLPPFNNPGLHCLVVSGATASEVAIYDPLRDTAPVLVSAAHFDTAWRARAYQMSVLTPR